MKILLLNDNPVVRKLVALSAQKTKDDLNVVWSVDEIEDTEYDLLIVDDAHYSDEVMAALQEKISYKTSLLMATRGNATPAGFDKVINKPFLPTDLVELFATIEKELTPAIKSAPVDEAKAEPRAIDLDSAFAEDEDEGFDITNLNDEMELGEFGLSNDDSTVKTNVLDHEEVQELQDLLEDTESLDDESLELDGLSLDDIELDENTADDLSSLEMPSSLEDELDDFGELEGETQSSEILSSIDEQMLELDDEVALGMGAESELDDAIEDFDLDDELLQASVEAEATALEDEVSVQSPILMDDDIHMGEEMATDELDALEGLSLEEFDEEGLAASDEDENEPLSEQSEESLTGLEDVFAGLEEIDEEENLAEIDEAEMLLNDDELDELEQQIQEAVDELGIGEMDQELDASELDELGIGDMGTLDGLDELDAIDERDIKLAIGEPVEEEPEIHIGQGSHASLDAEALDEAMGKAPMLELEDELESMSMGDEVSTAVCAEEKGTPAEGMEALQALLKALSNDEVAKSLKGLNINININFGNEK